jgi:hypothetical protein
MATASLNGTTDIKSTVHTAVGALIFMPNCCIKPEFRQAFANKAKSVGNFDRLTDERSFKLECNTLQPQTLCMWDISNAGGKTLICAFYALLALVLIVCLAILVAMIAGLTVGI